MQAYRLEMGGEGIAAVPLGARPGDAPKASLEAKGAPPISTTVASLVMQSSGSRGDRRRVRG